MAKGKARSESETLGIVNRIEALIEDGTPSPEACKTEGILQDSFYRLRAILKKKGAYNKPTVKFIDTQTRLKPGPKAFSKPRVSDKCVVIVTTSSSLRSILEGVF